MVSANRKMADTRSTLLECSVKVRQGRKWKSRWCVMTRQSPVSAEVILKFYKDQNALLTNRELGRERVCISADRYCGLEYGYRHPKNIYVLTVVLSDAVILLSFPTHERLLEWYHRIKNTLPSATEFRSRVSIPNKGKLSAGRRALYFYNDHFAITPEMPLKLIAAWDLSKVYRYGVFDGGFAFSVRSDKGSSTVNHILLLPNPEYIKNQFDSAMSVHLPSRWSTHSDVNPADRDHYRGMTNSVETQFMHRARENARNETVEQNNDNEGPEETDTLLTRTNSADSNCNTQKSTDTSPMGGLRDDVEMVLLRNLRHSQSELSVGSMGETVFGNRVLLCPPQKNTPFREQEYEVMASFDHYRSSVHEEVDLGSQAHLSHENEYQPSLSARRFLGNGFGGVSRGASRLEDIVNSPRFALSLSTDEREYVNLPSPKSTLPMNNTIHSSLRRKSPFLHLPFQKENNSVFDLSPPSSPPPPPPIQRKRTDSFVYSKETISVQRLAPHDEIMKPKENSGSVSSQFPIVETPIPFTHDDLVKPVGPMARLKRTSQSSESSSYIPSGSEYGDSSHYSSAASSRHNSFDRDTFQRPPPVPPKSIEALLSSDNFRLDTSLIDRLLLSSVPPIPPKPDHLRGRPLAREPGSPTCRSPTGRPPFLPQRKRCNTVPSFAAGDTEWLEDGNDGDNNEDEEKGYLIMKPAPEDNLKAVHIRSKSVPDEESVLGSQARSLPPTLPRSWTMSPGASSMSSRALHSPLGSQSFNDPSGSYGASGPSYVQCIPQSPIHGSDNMRVRTLKRSATIGVFHRRTSRSPSFTGKRPSLVRQASKQRRRASENISTSRTSDISLAGIPKPTNRRQDKYGSLDHRSMSLSDYRSEDSSLDIPESPTSPTTLFAPEDLARYKDECEEALPLSPPSSANSSPQMSRASSIASLKSETTS